LERTVETRWCRGLETPAEWKMRVRAADEIMAGALNATRKLPFVKGGTP